MHISHQHVVMLLHKTQGTERVLVHCRPADWLLLDGLQGGSGKGFAWESLSLPTYQTSDGWLLAGGLNAKNVGKAMTSLHPDAVDVSSGVAGPDSLRKDALKVHAFMEAVRHARTLC